MKCGPVVYPYGHRGLLYTEKALQPIYLVDNITVNSAVDSESVNAFHLNVKLLDVKFSTEKYETITAESGEEALEKIMAVLSDLILMNTTMPNSILDVWKKWR
jgi:CheY-like chemotaxis protein